MAVGWRRQRRRRQWQHGRMARSGPACCSVRRIDGNQNTAHACLCETGGRGAGAFEHRESTQLMHTNTRTHTETRTGTRTQTRQERAQRHKATRTARHTKTGENRAHPHPRTARAHLLLMRSANLVQNYLSSKPSLSTCINSRDLRHIINNHYHCTGAC